MPLPTRFDPELYQEFRPSYPPDLFAELKRIWSRVRGEDDPTEVLDVGCGTGLSLEAFSKGFPESQLFGIDPDPEMLECAHSRVPHAQLYTGRAESLPFDADSLELILVGSAYHWFDPVAFAQEADRVLKQGGFLFIFEYQFPKALENPDLNEWIRRQFNQHWRAPGQTPRGSLREITRGFERLGWKELPMSVPRMREPLTAKQVLGQILSQSRYLHSEAALSQDERVARRECLFREIQMRLPDQTEDLFDFRLSAHLWIRPQKGV